MWAACNGDKEGLKTVSMTVIASQSAYRARRNAYLARGPEAEQTSDRVPRAPDCSSPFRSLLFHSLLFLSLPFLSLGGFILGLGQEGCSYFMGIFFVFSDNPEKLPMVYTGGVAHKLHAVGVKTWSQGLL